MSGELFAEVELEEVLAEPAASLRARIFASKALVIRRRACDVAEFVALMRRLGTPVPHVLENFSLPGLREVIRISNLYRGGAPVGVHDGGAYWHTDMSYKAENTVFTALCAERVPRSGGPSGTTLVDCERAYGLLKDALRDGAAGFLPDDLDLDAAMVLHRFGNREQLTNPSAVAQALSSDQRVAVAPSVRHPLVLRHPVTGRRSLYAVAGTAMILEGRPEAESVRLLDLLQAFLLDRAPTHTHEYRPGDILVWDNLSTLHRGPLIERSDDEHDCRLLYRMNLDYMKHSPSESTPAGGAR